jgi:hypothetical protein
MWSGPPSTLAFFYVSHVLAFTAVLELTSVRSSPSNWTYGQKTKSRCHIHFSNSALIGRRFNILLLFTVHGGTWKPESQREV